MDLFTSLEKYLIQSKTQIPILGFILNLIFTGALSFVLKKVYIKYGSSLSNRRSFGNNFQIIAMTTMLIITIVKSSLALSLGLVGALSIIRFRAAIKEPEELGYLFIAISIGLGFGASQGSITFLALIIIISIIILTNNQARKDNVNNTLNLTIISEKPKGINLEEITKIINKYCSGVIIKRLDESSKILEVSFLVQFENYNKLIQTKENLQKIDKNINITYLDTSQISLS
jgi:hypothetical protein